MGQGEVLELLEKTKKRLSNKEISEMLGKSQSTTSTLLKKLIEQKEVKYVYEERQGPHKYRSRSGMPVKLHFV